MWWTGRRTGSRRRWRAGDSEQREGGGKNVVLTFEDATRVVVNLGMTGRLVPGSGPGPGPGSTHPAVLFQFADGGSLTYDDVRRFGRLRHLPASDWPLWSRRLGPEPLARSFTGCAAAPDPVPLQVAHPLPPPRPAQNRRRGQHLRGGGMLVCRNPPAHPRPMRSARSPPPASIARSGAFFGRAVEARRHHLAQLSRSGRERGPVPAGRCTPMVARAGPARDVARGHRAHRVRRPAPPSSVPGVSRSRPHSRHPGEKCHDRVPLCVGRQAPAPCPQTRGPEHSRPGTCRSCSWWRSRPHAWTPRSRPRMHTRSGAAPHPAPNSPSTASPSTTA